MKLLRKIIVTAILIIFIITIANTLFYYWLESSPVMDIAQETIQNNQQLMNNIGKVKTISPLFFSSKNVSWTGRRKKLDFDVFINGDVRNCTMKFTMEKTENGWIVKRNELKKCYDSECNKN